MAHNVMVTFQYAPDNSLTPVQLPATASFDEVRAAWSSQTGRSLSGHHFKEVGGEHLPVQGTLSQRLQPEAIMFAVRVEPFHSLWVYFRGVETLQTPVEVCEDTTAAQVLVQVRRGLGLGDRAMRLVFADQALHPEQSLSAQGVPRGAEVAAELLFAVTVKTIAALEFEYEESDDEEEEKELEVVEREEEEREQEEEVEEEEEKEEQEEEVEEEEEKEEQEEVEEEENEDPEVVVHHDRHVTCAASDLAACLLSDDLPYSEQRVLIGGRVVDAGRPIIDSLPPDDALLSPELDVVVERAIPVFVQRQAAEEVRWEEAVVWPSQSVKAVVRSPRDRVFVEGRQVDPRDTFSDIDARCGSVFVVAETMQVLVRDVKGRLRHVRVPTSATVEQLRLRLTEVEASGDFVMRVDDVALEEGTRPLSECGVREGAEVQLCRDERKRVEAGALAAAAQIEAGAGGGRPRAAAAVQGPSAWSEQAERALRECASLRRRLQAEEERREEERRRLEAEAARLRSDLEEAVRSLCELRARTSAGHGVQAGAGAARTAFAQPPPVRVDLRIDDFARDFKEIDVSFDLPPPVTTGAVRAAVAEKLCLDPAQVEIKRLEGRTRRSGEKVADVYVERRRGVRPDADAEGRLWEENEVDTSDRLLTDDDELFFLPGRRRSFLSVFEK